MSGTINETIQKLKEEINLLKRAGADNQAIIHDLQVRVRDLTKGDVDEGVVQSEQFLTED